MIGGLAVTTTCGETAKAPENVAKGEARCEAVGGAQHRHVMTAHVPGGHDESSDQSAGEYASRLQRVEAENFAPVVGVGAPVVDDVKNFRANDSGEHDENTEIPGVVAINALFLGIADADPESDQDARSDEESIGRQVETANMKKLWKHVSLDAPGAG